MNYWPHFTPPWCHAKISSQQTSSPGDPYRFGKSLWHDQQKRSPFENPKTCYQWRNVQFHSSNTYFLIAHLGSCFSIIKCSKNGAPQGSVLNLILFSIMICQALFCCPQRCMLMISAFGKVVQHQAARTPVRILFPWSTIDAISLVFKSLHSKPLQFCSRKRENRTQSIHHRLTTVFKEYKYLGVIFQRNGLNHSNVQHVSNKCQTT